MNEKQDASGYIAFVAQSDGSFRREFHPLMENGSWEGTYHRMVLAFQYRGIEKYYTVKSLANGGYRASPTKYPNEVTDEEVFRGLC